MCIRDRAIGALKKFLVSIGANTASLLGLTVAEGTATAGATVLNIALGALGIGVIIAAVSGLVIAVKKDVYKRQGEVVKRINENSKKITSEELKRIFENAFKA